MKSTVGKKQYPHTYYLSTYLIKSLLDSFFVKGETRLNSCFPIDFRPISFGKNEGGFFFEKIKGNAFCQFKEILYFFIFLSGFMDNAAVNANVWSSPGVVGGVGWIQGNKKFALFFFIVRYSKH